MKTIIQLLIAALILNAGWHIGNAYYKYYNFKDDVQQAALFGNSKSEVELQNRVLQLASQSQLPLAAENVSVRRENEHTFVNAAYTEQVQIVPTYFYPYEFKMNLDVLTIGAQATPVR